MAYLIISSAASKSSEITACSTDNWREYWRDESVRTGTDWISISETVSAILFRLADESAVSS